VAAKGEGETIQAGRAYVAACGYDYRAPRLILPTPPRSQSGSVAVIKISHVRADDKL
jgi:hypothetical protein